MFRKSLLLLSAWLFACSPSVPPARHSPSEARSRAASELFERGSRLASEGDSVRAEQYLAAALHEGYDWNVALPALMRVCLTGSRFRAALSYAAPYVKKHPDAVWLRHLVGSVYLGIGQALHAREHLLAIVGRAPFQARTEYLLGQTEWEGLGDAAAAGSHFREYLRLEPDGEYAREVAEWLRLHAPESARQAALPAPAPGAAPARDEPSPADASAHPTPAEGAAAASGGTEASP